VTLDSENHPLQLRPPKERSNQPNLAIVVTSRCDVTLLLSRLASLASECSSSGAKLIVAHAGPPPDFAALLGAERMSLTVLTAPDGTSVDDLRRIGAQHAGRNIIAFVKDGARERLIWAQHLCQGWASWCERGGRISLPSPSDAATIDVAWSRPYLSVVVPAHNAAATLPQALAALSNTDLPRELWELVVVDDGSTDETSPIAAQYADKVVKVPDGPHGPGYARNRGFEMTLGVCVAFVNADVMVRPNTLRRFYEVFKREPNVGAVFGSYDAQATASGFVSQYHNLLQHYHHQRHAGDASTFWSACGAVRGAAFEQAGCFDEWHFRRRQLEDIELGQRMRVLGHRVLLRPEIQVTHLKSWTLRGILKAEIFDRGIPWMRLVNRAVVPTTLERRGMQATKKTNIALTWLGALLLVLGIRPSTHLLLAGAAVCFAVVAINDSAQLALFRRQRGMVFALKTAAFNSLYYFVSGIAILFGWVAQHAVGEPRPAAVTEAFAELDVKTWPPVPNKRKPSPPGGIPVIETRADVAYRERRSRTSTEVVLEDPSPPAIDLPPGAQLQ
jgi:glycosyltransferase involved in cell wall biosynthesis